MAKQNMKRIILASLIAIIVSAQAIAASNTTSTTSDNDVLGDFAAGNSSSRSDQDEPSTSSEKNSPDGVNFFYSRDNEGDTTSHLGGDLYFGDNTHLGIYGESSKYSATSTGAAAASTQAKTFDISLGTDSRKTFSGGAEFTYFGAVDQLTEDSVHVPLIWNPTKNWSLTFTPGEGVINIYKNTRKTTLGAFQVNDGSVTGIIDYYGFKYWHLSANAESHSYSPTFTYLTSLKGLSRDLSNYEALTEQFINYSQGLSATYSFAYFDLGAEIEKSQLAFDGSDSSAYTLKCEIFWTDNFSTPLSVSYSTTQGTESTGQPYPNITAVSAGINYDFD